MICLVHLERKSAEDWVSACKNTEVVRVRSKDRSGKTWGDCVRQGMDPFGIKQEWAVKRNVKRDLIWGKCLILD